MAFTARLINNPLCLSGKHIFSTPSAVCLRRFCVFEYNNDPYFSHSFKFGVNSSFSLIKRTCVNSVSNQETVNVSNQEAANVLRERVNLSEYPKARLDKIISFLLNEGFSVDDGIQMVSECPEILRKTEKEIDGVFSALRDCGLRDNEAKEILKKSPKLLCCNVNTILSRYQTLKQMFSRQLIVQILLRCPNIMFIKWGKVQQNFEYVKNVMLVSDKQIAYSSALDSPVEMIKARHVFLTRAGLYVTPDPKSILPSNNPSLSSIVDTDDIYFAESVAKLTAEEYDVFLGMFQMGNVDRENEIDSDSEESE